jgi:hypothetical protein
MSEVKKDKYGNLDVDFQSTITAAYPEVTFATHAPGCWGANPDIILRGKELNCPDGQYSSAKHFHSAGHDILAMETSAECNLNIAGNPLFLLVGRAFNGDYQTLSRTFFLFGRNEDGSFFLHKIRPQAAKGGDLTSCRNWMWAIKAGERIAARQGDLGFISRESGKPAGKWVDLKTIRFGNHSVEAEEWRVTSAGRAFGFNITASHGEHDPVFVEGWTEARLARAWGSSSAD